MGEVLQLLVNPYEIRRIIIDNFTFGNNVSIEVELEGNGFGFKTLLFKDVKNINCNPEHYHEPGKGMISTLDISEKKWDGIRYRVDILEDAFSFYCGDIRIK